MIPPRNLSLLSNRLARAAGRRIPEAVLERDYCLAWFLVAPAAGREVKGDITIRERLVFPLEDRPVLRAYEEYTDLPEDVKIRVYSLGEIAAEKVVALMDRARNEPRDLYEVWYLVSGRHVDLADLVQAIEDNWNCRVA